MKSSAEMVPMDYFTRVVRWWWLAVLCALLGGAGGFGVSRAQPPLYEAQALFSAVLDVNKIDFMHFPVTTPSPYKMTQYDEDLALSVVDTSLLRVMPQVVDFAGQNGVSLDVPGLLAQSTIERENGLWNVRFRSSDPAFAQKLVNDWAQLGFADLQTRQKAGAIPNYVLFDLVHLADLPKSPSYFQTSGAVLAGAAIGLVIGFLLLNLPVMRKILDR